MSANVWMSETALDNRLLVRRAQDLLAVLGFILSLTCAAAMIWGG